MATTESIADRGTAEEGIEHLACGCSVSAPTRTSGSRVLSRCNEADGLWRELREVRDEMRAGTDRGEKVGHKRRIDAFARARADYQRHVFGEVS